MILLSSSFSTEFVFVLYSQSLQHRKSRFVKPLCPRFVRTWLFICFFFKKNKRFIVLILLITHFAWFSDKNIGKICFAEKFVSLLIEREITIIYRGSCFVCYDLKKNQNESAQNVIEFSYLAHIQTNKQTDGHVLFIVRYSELCSGKHCL